MRRRHANALKLRLDAANADAVRWRAEAASVLPALGAAIHRQFQRWGLTPDEQHVALMLLNGLSAKQIADFRHSDVRFVRKQIFEIYRKTGLSGRAALSAFFLQDLLFLAGRPPRDHQELVPEVNAATSHWN
jgi:DNA-binding NarL/FixJ family response regulator